MMMTLEDLLRKTVNVDCDGVWVNERTTTPVGLLGFSLSTGVERSSQLQ